MAAPTLRRNTRARLTNTISNVELLKHAIGIFTLDQFIPSIRLFKNVAGFLIGQLYGKRQPVAQFHLPKEKGYGLGHGQAELT